MSARSALIAMLVPALVVTAVGLPLLVLTSPAFTRALAQRYSLAAEAGLPRERMVQLAEEVRSFVAGSRTSLPVQVDGRSGFDASAVSHLVDVRVALRWGRLAALLAAGVALAALAGLWRDRHAKRRAFGCAALVTLLPVALAALVGTLDFNAFFSAFHGVFFAPGTWTFPWDSLLIQLFPETFWLVAALSWAVGIVVMAVAYGCAWLALRHPAPGEHESSTGSST